MTRSLQHVVVEQVFSFLIFILIVAVISISASLSHLEFFVVSNIFLVIEVRERGGR